MEDVHHSMSMYHLVLPHQSSSNCFLHLRNQDPNMLLAEEETAEGSLRRSVVENALAECEEFFYSGYSSLKQFAQAGEEVRYCGHYADLCAMSHPGACLPDNLWMEGRAEVRAQSISQQRASLNLRAPGKTRHDTVSKQCIICRTL